jgi:hypothetical protein
LSEIRVTTISATNGTGPVTLTKQQAAKFWASFNGTGTAAIRDSFNNSSLTDNGTGDYTNAYTNAMSNANYCIDTAASRFMSVIKDATGFSGTDPTTTTIRTGHYNATPVHSDGHFVSVKVTGDLA